MNYSMTAAVSYHIMCLTRGLFCLLTCAAGAEVSRAPQGRYSWDRESLEALVKD